MVREDRLRTVETQLASLSDQRDNTVEALDVLQLRDSYLDSEIRRVVIATMRSRPSSDEGRSRVRKKARKS